MFITILNHETSAMLLVYLTDEMAEEISDKYDNDAEAWMLENDIEKRFHFRLSDCSWMTTDDVPEITACNAGNNEQFDLFLFS